MHFVFDLHRNDEIRVMDGFKRRVHEGFIKVEDETLLAQVLRQEGR